VLKAVGGDAALPYIAVRTRSIPRLVNIEREGLEPRDDENPPQGIQQAVLAHGEPALIPDLAAVESWIRSALHH
jgi:chemosensory pili system protein ChpC